MKNRNIIFAAIVSIAATTSLFGCKTPRVTETVTEEKAIEMVEEYRPEKAKLIGYNVSYEIQPSKNELIVEIEEIFEGYIYRVKRTTFEDITTTYTKNALGKELAGCLISACLHIALPMLWDPKGRIHNLSGRPVVEQKDINTRDEILEPTSKKESHTNPLEPGTPIWLRSGSYNKQEYYVEQMVVSIDEIVSKVTPQPTEAIKLDLSVDDNTFSVPSFTIPKEQVQISITRLEQEKKEIAAQERRRKLEEIRQKKLAEEQARKAAIEERRLKKLAEEQARKDALEKVNLTDLEKLKKQCAEIGFSKGTEKFGECVLRLSK